MRFFQKFIYTVFLIMAVAGFSGEPYAQQAGGALRLDIITTCKNGAAVFRIRNEGLDWPKMAIFYLYRGDNKDVLSKRRLRLKTGQSATFKIKSADQISSSIDLFIKTSWLNRRIKPDAYTSCARTNR